MPFVPVDINQIKLDQPAGGYVPIDINKIKLDAPQISTGMDVAKSMGSSAAQGALGVPLGFADLGNQLVSGPQLLGRGIAENVDKMIGIDPQPRGDLWQPFYGSGDAVKDLGIDYQPQTKLGMAAQIPSQLVGAMIGGKTLNAMATTPQSNSRSFLSNNSSEPSVIVPKAQEMRDVSSKDYGVSSSQGGALKEHMTDSWVNEASKVLPQTTGGKTVLGETPTTQLVARMDGLKGKPLTLAEAQEIDSALGDMSMNHVDPKTGKLLAEGEKLRQIQQSLRDHIEKAGPNDIAGGKQGFDTWKDARDMWAASSRMGEVERIKNYAANTDNPVTTMRNGFRSMIKSNPTLRGYTADEKIAIQNAAKTGLITGALKTAGSKLISGVAGATGGAMGGGFPGAMMGAAAGEAAGFPMRAAANKLQANRADKVSEAIANRPIVRRKFP